MRQRINVDTATGETTIVTLTAPEEAALLAEEATLYDIVVAEASHIRALRALAAVSNATARDAIDGELGAAPPVRAATPGRP